MQVIKDKQSKQDYIHLTQSEWNKFRMLPCYRGATINECYGTHRKQVIYVSPAKRNYVSYLSRLETLKLIGE